MNFTPFYYPSAMLRVMNQGRLPRKRLDNLIHRRLREVLVSAYRYVPHFRRVMQKVDYNPIRHYRGIKDLRLLPIGTKEDRRKKRIGEFIMRGANLRHCFSDKTSGSTGIPIRIYRTPYERALQIAKWIRVLLINGYSPKHKVMSLSLPEKVRPKRSMVQRLGLFRREIVSFLLTPEEIVDRLLDYNPDVLYGNRQQIDFVALELKRRNVCLNALKLLVESGAVIREDSRRFHQKQFGTQLVESYGSEEMGIMAYEVKGQSGLCLCEDLTFFEFLDDEGNPVPPGKPGRVVVTDLVGKLNPFIRYDQGDRAVYEVVRESNGEPSKRIVKILGRECDYVVLPDGTHRLYYDFYDIMSRYEDIFQCRIVQKTRHLIQVQVVTPSDYLSRIRQDLMQRLRQPFPPEIRFEILPIDAITPDPSGKIRMFISEVDTLPDLTLNMHRPELERKT